MKIDCVDQLPFAADTVFEHACRDLHLMAAMLPDVERIDLLSWRELSATVVERVDRVVAHGDGGSALPPAEWSVTSQWDFERQQAIWSIDVHAPQDAALSSGSLTVRSDEGGAEVSFDGELCVLGHALPLANRAMGIAMAPMLESALDHAVETNLAALLGGLEGTMTTALRKAS